MVASGPLQSFAAVVDDRTRILVVGSMPGVASLQQQQYYAHPRNAFWPIMQALFAVNRELAYDERLAALQARGIGLWDVFSRCHREGSLDSAICTETAECNDFAALLLRYPSIHSVFFNGRLAEKMFCRHVLPGLPAVPARLQALPSTSPANASMTPAQKMDAWRVVSECLDND